jgi:chaperonin GroES
MKIRPLQDKILVKRIAAEKTTAGGFIISDIAVAVERPQKGNVVARDNVVAVGKGKEPRGRRSRHRGIGG